MMVGFIARGVTSQLRIAGVIGLVLVAGACAGPVSPAPSVREGALRYVALGDSYTIGTSVSEEERWPNQLVGRMQDELALVANLGVNGYTSRDLITDELPALDELEPELVTVQIGVNDVVQGVPDTVDAQNVAIILDALLERLPADRILAVATPDYTLTPQGGSFGDAEQQRDGIVRNNAILREASDERGIIFVPEIFEISQMVVDDGSLVASDGLHPSGAQYALWVEVIQPAVGRLLGPGAG